MFVVNQLQRLKMFWLRMAVLIVFLGLGSAHSALWAKNAKTTPEPTSQTIVGLHEWIEITDFDATMKAKMDTGATTSSLSAGDIERFEKEGEPWVRFRVLVEGYEDQLHELPLARVSKIKRRAEEGKSASKKNYSERPVVELTVRMGSDEQTIEVGLTDRSRFLYPFLMGAKSLQAFHSIVDPSARKLLGSKP